MSTNALYSIQQPTTTPYFLLPKHLEDLHSSGLSNEMITDSGIHSVASPLEIQRILGWLPHGVDSAMVIPYRFSNGYPRGYCRLKPTETLVDCNGHGIKYLSPKDQPNHLYFPPNLLQQLVPGGFVIITEGEKKALCASQHGFPTVSISGVWCFRDQHKKLLDDLEYLVHNDLRLFICFDSDTGTNLNVRKAEVTLANELTLAGASVKIMRIPPATDGGKQGLDDFICNGGLSRGQLQQIMFEAEPWKFENGVPDNGYFREIADWRQELHKIRIAEWKFGNPQFDGSPPGLGKSYADRQLMKLSNSTLTVVPTLQNARDLETELSSGGILAQAYPDLTQVTCRNHAEAVRARKMSLPVTKIICPRCPFKHDCEQDGYLSLINKAGREPHSICTQERFARNTASLSLKRDVIFFHEEVRNAFQRSEAVKVEDFIALLDLLFFASNSSQALGLKHEAQFFDALWRTVCEIVMFSRNCRTVQPIKTLAYAFPSADWQRSLWKKIEYYRQLPENKGFVINGTALRTVVDAIQMKCDLVIRPARMSQEAAEIIVTWKTPIPAGPKIWLADGSEALHNVQSSIGSLVVSDRTPKGKIRRQKLVCQIPRMIRKKTSPSTVKKLVRDVLSRLPDHRKVGLIVHRKHLSAIKELKAREFPTQIHRFTHFRSGEDTGSNSWLDCDVLIILGTPYVPPRAIQKELIRQGKIEAANRDGLWGDRFWYGQSIDQRAVTISSRGYRDPDWHDAYKCVVRSKLIQGMERSRSYLPYGIPLTLVFSLEPLGIPVFDKKWFKGVSLTESRLLTVLSQEAQKAGLSGWSKKKCSVGIAATDCISNPIQRVADIFAVAFSGAYSINQNAQRGVATSVLAKKLNVSARTVRDQLKNLSEKDLVLRIGKRSGWLPGIVV
ncbi:MAG: DUF3854 domain-containing protein [Planctomycetaceae bacterium]|nr:DUF3854 domain-containing protein [Planctomycetaceae bacterium]